MKKVLVVDDSSFVRTYHKSILQQGNYLSEAASNGAEALEKSLSIDYDLILCDINMLIMDGITFIQKYRKSGKETPIIIITSIEESRRNQSVLRLVPMFMLPSLLNRSFFLKC